MLNKSKILNIIYSNKTIEFELIRRKNQKNIILKVLENKQIVVSASKYTLQRTIKKFVLSQASWIIEKLKKIKDIKVLTVQSEVLYLGENHKVCELLEDCIQEHIEKELDMFYKNEAKRVISNLVEFWSLKMQLFPNKIGFRKTKTRWGSCNSKNNLSFNTQLMKYDKKIIEYVVVHELAHIKHKNHSKEFWSLVQEFIPNFKERQKALKNN